MDMLVDFLMDEGVHGGFRYGGRKPEGDRNLVMQQRWL